MMLKAFPGTDIYRPNDLPEIDVLIITHEHWDHMDYATLRDIRTKVKTVICPLGIADYLRYWGYADEQIVELDWYDSFDFERSGLSALIDLVGLSPERHKHIRELSKGYRQRVGLAQALIGDPELLILDEPTTGLDPNQLVEIRALIRDLTANRESVCQSEGRSVSAAVCQQSGPSAKRSIILSTHILQEVREMCDRVIILDHGTVKADLPIDQIDNLEQLFHEKTQN